MSCDKQFKDLEARIRELNKQGNPILDDKAKQAIAEIIQRGNDAEIRKKGDGYIVLEVKKTIKYSAQ